MPFAYPALLLIGAHVWIVLYDVGEQGVSAYLSYAIQQLVVVLVYALIDARLRSPRLRFLLASLAALYVAYIQLDALLIKVVGLSGYRTLITFAAGGSSTLSEIGLRPARLALLIAAVIATCLAGGVAHRLLDRWRVAIPLRTQIVLWAFAAVILPLGFVWEQARARDDDRYVYRSLELPGYLQLHQTADRSYEVHLQSPKETLFRHAQLARIRPPRNPRHVLFILLESMRADAIDPVISPTLSALADASLDFTNAHAEAIFTPLSWNVLLLDRPAHMFMWPRTMMAPTAPGSWPLNVLKSAGYQIWISSSTDLAYGHFLPFLVGDYHLIDQMNMVRADHFERWQRDDLATSQMVDWIDASPFDRPTFMLLQLDSTHWTYQFPPDRAVVKPYSQPLSMPVPLTTREEFRLLHNRYRNCVHHVDSEIARVLSALEQRGLSEDTAVVAVADHGEGFTPGIQGHAVLCEATTRVPLMMRLPGIVPQRVEELVSFRNLFPTLFDYLEIESLDDRLMLGRSVLPPNSGESAILTFSPDGRRADLRLADGSRIQFNVLMSERSATFTPVGRIDESIDWRAMLDERMRFSGSKPARTRQPTVSAAAAAREPSG